MGLFDSIGKTVSSVGGAVGHAWDTTRDSFERSDVGKVVSTAAAPIVAPQNAVKDALQGDWNGAGNRLFGAFLSTVNVPSTASQAFPFLKDLFNSNSITRPFAESGEAASTLLKGDNISQSKWNALRDMYLTEGAVAGGVAAAPYAAAGASSLGSWAAANPLAASVAGTSVYSGIKSGNVAQVAGALAPGLDLPQFPSIPSDWTDAFNNLQNAFADANPKVNDPNPVQYVNPYSASSGQQSAMGMASVLAVAIGIGIFFAFKKIK